MWNYEKEMFVNRLTNAQKHSILRKNGSFERLRGNLVPTVKTCSDNAGVGKTQKTTAQVYSVRNTLFLYLFH